MIDAALKSAAYALAEATPKHLGQPTSPPQGWRLEGADLVVLLADGRKVRGPVGAPIVPTGEGIAPVHPVIKQVENNSLPASRGDREAPPLGGIQSPLVPVPVNRVSAASKPRGFEVHPPVKRTTGQVK